MLRWRVLVILVSLIFAAALESASAFGLFAFKPSDGEVWTAGFRAFVSRTGMRDDLILQAGFAGSASEFALVVPVPTKPNIGYADAGIFDELYRIVHPKIIPGADTPPNTSSSPKPIRLENIAVIQPSQPEALVMWLQSKGCRVQSEAQRIIQEYANKGFYFVVATVSVVPKPEARWLSPVIISFESDKALLPMRLLALIGRSILSQVFVSTSVRVSADGLAEYGSAGSPTRSPYRLNEFPMFFQFVRTNTMVTELRGLIDPGAVTADVYFKPNKQKPASGG